jgi:hypothetical protein
LTEKHSFCPKLVESLEIMQLPKNQTPNFTIQHNLDDCPNGDVFRAYSTAQTDILGSPPLTVHALDEEGVFKVEAIGPFSRSVLTVATHQGPDGLDFDIVSFEVNDIFFSNVSFSYSFDQPNSYMFRMMTSMLEEIFMLHRAAITDVLRQHCMKREQTPSTLNVPPPITDYVSQYDAEIDAAEAQLLAVRAGLLADLRVLGITRIEMDYSGYDDSGNVESVQYTPSTIVITEELNSRVENFGWDFAYPYNPGFEVCCGGSGCIDWCLNTDKIDLTYCDDDVEAYPVVTEGL